MMSQPEKDMSDPNNRLIKAVYDEDIPEIMKLVQVQGADADLVVGGYPLVMKALYYDRKRSFGALVAMGANLDVKANDGRTLDEILTFRSLSKPMDVVIKNEGIEIRKDGPQARI